MLRVCAAKWQLGLRHAMRIEPHDPASQELAAADPTELGAPPPAGYDPADYRWVPVRRAPAMTAGPRRSSAASSCSPTPASPGRRPARRRSLTPPQPSANQPALSSTPMVDEATFQHIKTYLLGQLSARTLLLNMAARRAQEPGYAYYMILLDGRMLGDGPGDLSD